MFPSLDISTSALVAQRARMNAISGNLANLSTTHNAQGERVPYQERYVIFQADESVGANGAPGVEVSDVVISQKEPEYKFEPNNPDAIQEGPKKGYVAYPDIDMMAQFTNAMEAARSYEANLGAIDIAKNLQQQTLRILA